MLSTGAVLIATTQLLPQFLQTELNYTALLAGLVLSPGGIVTLFLMPVVGYLVGVVQPKYLIMVGACIVAFSMWYLTGLTGDITYGYAALSRIFLAAGLPFLFLPVTTACYDGVPPVKTNQASALINVARNIGGSMGVALAQSMLAQRQQFHQSRLIEHMAPLRVCGGMRRSGSIRVDGRGRMLTDQTGGQCPAQMVDVRNRCPIFIAQRIDNAVHQGYK
jgi:DHA2 family multidrug resistance protein